MHENSPYFLGFGAPLTPVPRRRSPSPEHKPPSLPSPATRPSQALQAEVARYSSGFLKPWSTFHRRLGAVTGETPRDVKFSGQGQVRRASLKAAGWLVSILLPAHLGLWGNPICNGLPAPSATRRHRDR